MEFETAATTEKNARASKETAIIWTLCKIVVGILCLVTAPSQNGFVYGVAGLLIICAALMFLLGSLKKISWLLLPEILEMAGLTLFLAAMCLYSFGAGIYFFFAGNEVICKTVSGQRSCVENHRSSEFIFLGFYYLIFCAISGYALTLISGDRFCAKMSKFESVKFEYSKLEEENDAETGECEEKTESVAVLQL